MQTSRLVRALLAGIPPVLAVLVFLPAVSNGFVWDDWLYLFNVEFQTADLWAKALTAPLLNSINYFRPLPIASFLLEIRVHDGHSAPWMHFTNIVLHATNSLMVALLARQVAVRVGTPSTRARIIASVSGLLYGCHPAMTETVVWISGRFDLIFTSCLLLALLASTFLVNPVARALLVAVAFLFAALSKEMAIAFPLVLFAWNLAMVPRPLRPYRTFLRGMAARGEHAVYIAVVCAGFLYLAIRAWALGYVYSQPGISFSDLETTILGGVLLTTETFVRYLFVMIYPYANLNIVHPHAIPVPHDDLFAWMSLVTSAGILLLIAWLIRRNATAGWLSAATVFSLLPVLHLIPLPIVDNIIHERYLTFPLVLFVLVLAAITANVMKEWGEYGRQARTIKVSMVIVAMYMTIMSIISVRTLIPVWRDDLTLWSWAVAAAPDSIVARANLGVAYAIQNRYAESLEQGMKAIELAPDMYLGWMVAGTAHGALGNRQTAVAFQKQALSLAPYPGPDLYVRAADALMMTGQYEEAREILVPIVSRESHNRDVNRLMAIICLRLDQRNTAQRYIDLATFLYSPEAKVEYRKQLVQVMSGTRYPEPDLH